MIFEFHRPFECRKAPRRLRRDRRCKGQTGGHAGIMGLGMGKLQMRHNPGGRSERSGEAEAGGGREKRGTGEQEQVPREE